MSTCGQMPEPSILRVLGIASRRDLELPATRAIDHSPGIAVHDALWCLLSRCSVQQAGIDAGKQYETTNSDSRSEATFCMDDTAASEILMDVYEERDDLALTDAGV